MSKPQASPLHACYITYKFIVFLYGKIFNYPGALVAINSLMTLGRPNIHLYGLVLALCLLLLCINKKNVNSSLNVVTAAVVGSGLVGHWAGIRPLLLLLLLLS